MIKLLVGGISSILLVGADPSVAMPFLKVITLRGDVIALDVTTIQTVLQLKAMLLEQFPCEDPIEQKIRGVAVFQGNSLLNRL